MEWEALILSLKLASLTTLILTLVVVPLAFVMSRQTSSIFSFLEAALSLPLVLPPTVLGFYLLLLLSSVKLAFTFTGLLLASLIYSFPFALQPTLAAFQNLDSRWLESSWLLGESKWRTFLRIAVPLSKDGILSGIILTFTHTLGEFGVVLMIGGNIPSISRTLSLALYDQVEAANYEQANHTALLLLVFSVCALTVVSVLRRKGRAR